MLRLLPLGSYAATYLLVLLQALAAQGQEAVTPPTHAVTGAPFAAVKSTRIVSVQPDGTTKVVRQEHSILIARDTDGRMLMVGADRAGDSCELPILEDPPVCDLWKEALFDPTTSMMWHWCEGERCDKKQLTQMDLEESQMAEIERQTTVLEGPPREREVPNVRTAHLGEKTMEGILATGIRITTLQNGPDGKPQESIHEVWKSEKMRLVVQVIDGDPKGELRITALSKVSLTPSPALFKAPTNRIVRHWKDGSRYANDDVANFSQWPVRSTAN